MEWSIPWSGFRGENSLKRFLHSYFVYSFIRDPLAIISVIVLSFLVIVSFGAPLIAPHDPYNPATVDIMDSEMPPIWMPDSDTRFLLGTDTQGRDMLSTMLYGMRVSILIGIGAVIMQAFIGIMIGLTAGYRGGRIDAFLMRMADVQLSFSTYMVAIFMGALFQAAFGMGTWEKFAVPLIIAVIGLAEWPQYARTVRASVMAEKKKEYVEAAKVIGLKSSRIMWRHILPQYPDARPGHIHRPGGQRHHERSRAFLHRPGHAGNAPVFGLADQGGIRLHFFGLLVDNPVPRHPSGGPDSVHQSAGRLVA